MLGDILPAAEIRLQAGGAVHTRFGSVAWMSDGFILDSSVKGGLMKGLGKMFFGESLFMTTYTASRPDSTVVFASTAPGKILTIDMAKTSLICRKGVFLCTQITVKINIVLIKRFTAGFFGGEGFILQQIQRSGMAFLEVDGDVMKRVLAPGEVTRVDTGNVFAFKPSISYKIETVKGAENTSFGGEGLFLAKLADPGKVYMQTTDTAEFTGWTAQGLPTSK